MLKHLKIAVISSIAFFYTASADIERGLTPDFHQWLSTNGYASHGFDRTDLKGGAYGGKALSSQQVKNNPIIFIHGNSDIAVGTGTTTAWQTGWTESIKYFISKGYTKAELYATTWGPGDTSKSQDQTHSKEYLTYLRSFVEAVIQYTGATKVDIIGHSMGVTLGRAIIKGGVINASQNPFNLGPALSSKVDTFVGIAGANWGLSLCYTFPTAQTCNALNGFYPGFAIGPMGMS